MEYRGNFARWRENGYELCRLAENYTVQLTTMTAKTLHTDFKLYGIILVDVDESEGKLCPEFLFPVDETAFLKRFPIRRA